MLGARGKRAIGCRRENRIMVEHTEKSHKPNVRARNAVKLRNAANDALRPGENCRAAPLVYRPQVDLYRCEGKADCVAVCPYYVFDVRKIDEDQYRTLPVRVRLKLWAHGKKIAYIPNTDACRACGLCVVACPEKATTLVRIGDTA